MIVRTGCGVIVVVVVVVLVLVVVEDGGEVEGREWC